VVLGGVLTGAVTLFQVQLISKREREARESIREQEREDRRDAFERETLLALQDAIIETRQAVFRDFDRRMAVLAEKGSWPVRSPGVLLPSDWAEADERVIRLHARVFDDELQMLIEHFRDVSARALTAQEQSAVEGWMTQMSTRLEEINARIGVLLARVF
jgi:hypothetical protein